MNICVIGAGYVGLVGATCFADMGNHVICVEQDQSKLDSIYNHKVPFYEPGLEEFMQRNIEAGRLTFETRLEPAVLEADIIFNAVGTPPLPDGTVDMRYVDGVFLELIDIAKQHAFTNFKIIVNKSTVPVGTARRLMQIIADEGMSEIYRVVSNPEFLREGSAMHDFFHPDRIVLGSDDVAAIDKMKVLYAPLYRIDTPIVTTSLETAELAKYAANSFLATKISFINEMATLCEKVGGNVQDVAKIMGMDGRIGKYFLHAGPGYGGSCFPKDTQALIQIAKDFGYDLKITKATEQVNTDQKARIIEVIKSKCGNSLNGQKFAVLGLSFKPNTDDIRDSSSIYLIHNLLKNGADISVFDPVAMQNARAVFGDQIRYADNVYTAAQGADGVILMTEWNSFRELDLRTLKEDMRGNFFFDFRSVYTNSILRNAGFNPYCIGTPI